MPRLLALDWDESELRYLCADVLKGTLSVHKLGSAPLTVPASETDEPLSANTLSRCSISLPPLLAALRPLIKEERLDTPTVFLALDRNKADVLYQTLPPCSEQEIPTLLKNQILRELPHYAEHDPLDFAVLGGAATEEQRLLAAAVPLVFRQELVRSFRSLGKAVRHIGFRPLAAAELFLHTQYAADEPEPVLLVNAVKTDVEIVLLLGKEVYSVRSFRLPEHLGLAEITEQIAEEVERTAAVGVEQADVPPLRKVFVFGGENEWTQLVSSLSQKQLEAVVINPFTLPNINVAKNTEVPDGAGRFAALCGLLLSGQTADKSGAVLGRLRTIDLLFPKEPPKPRNFVLPILLSLVLLGVLGFGAYQWNAGVIAGLEAELARVNEEHQKTALQLQADTPNYQVLLQVFNWESMNVPWLDELKELSQVFPREEDLVITRMSFTAGRVGVNPRAVGTIQLGGMVRDPMVLWKLRNDLLARQMYLVRYSAPTPNPAGGGYPWLFQLTIYRLK